MAGCAAQTFSNFSQERFSRLLAKAASEGVAINGPSGTFTYSGVTVTWTYDASSETLTVQCTKAPFFISCGTVNANIHSLIEGCP